MEYIDLWRYVGALLMVGGLMAAALVGVRRFGVPGMAKPERTRRLRVVESLILTPRQRLVLVRRDETEHLILLGPEGASLIEKAIAAPVPTLGGESPPDDSPHMGAPKDPAA